MGAPLGNEYWRQRADMSEDGKKLSVEEVKIKISEYIERCINDRLYEVDYVGKDAIEVQKPKMINMSIYGACAYLAINLQTWTNWKKDEKYLGVLTRAEVVFKSYNIEGASAGLLQQNIIARLEGLKDNQDVTTGGKPIEPKNVISFGGKEIEI